MRREIKFRFGIAGIVLALWAVAVVCVDGVHELPMAAGIVLTIIGSIVVFIVILVLSLFTLWFLLINFVFGRQQRRFQRAMMNSGRFIQWEHVREKLGRGEGSLILDEQDGIGRTRVWWTSDDICAAAPVDLPQWVWSPEYADVNEIVDKSNDDRVVEYARECIAKYTDECMGLAFLTEIESSRVRDLFRRTPEDPLSKRFPGARIATLITADDKPHIGWGDDTEAILTFIVQRSQICEKCGCNFGIDSEHCPECGG